VAVAQFNEGVDQQRLRPVQADPAHPDRRAGRDAAVRRPLLKDLGPMPGPSCDTRCGPRASASSATSRSTRSSPPDIPILCYSKICTHVGCPTALYEQQTHHLLCPCHQSTFDLADAGTSSSDRPRAPMPQLAITVDADGYLVAQQATSPSRSARASGSADDAHQRGPATAPVTESRPIIKAGGAADYVDERVGVSKFLKKNLTKVFPDHWSFMLGEIALYSFIVCCCSPAPS
jgi:hypothetical protein